MRSLPASGTSPVTLPEIGIAHQRASEVKRLSETGEPAIREEVPQATKDGRRPSRASAATGPSLPHGLFSKGHEILV